MHATATPSLPLFLSLAMHTLLSLALLITWGSSVAMQFTTICIGPRLTFRPWLTLTSSSSSSPCLFVGDPHSLSMLALRPLSNTRLLNGSISPTAATSSIKQSLPEMKPATRHLRRLPLHQDLRPALETAVSPATPAMAAAVRAPAEAAAPTSIPSYHHGHHPHEGPTPPPACHPLATLFVLLKIRWQHL